MKTIVISDELARKLEELEDIRRRAAQHVRKYVNKHGEMLEYDDPQYMVEVNSIRLYLQALGILGKPEGTPLTHEAQRETYEKMTPEQRILAHERAIEEERARLAESRH